MSNNFLFQVIFRTTKIEIIFCKQIIDGSFLLKLTGIETNSDKISSFHVHDTTLLDQKILNEYKYIDEMLVPVSSIICIIKLRENDICTVIPITSLCNS